MGFIADTKRILESYEAGFNASNEKFNAEKKRNDEKLRKFHITRAGYNAAMEKPSREHARELDELLKSHVQQVRDALESYEAGLDRRYLRTPDSINQDDVALLSNSAVELSAADVEAMFSRYEGNMAMQGVVSDYESKHKTGAKITYYSHDVRKAAAEDYAGGVIGSMRAVNGDTLGMRFAYYATASAVPGALVGE